MRKVLILSILIFLSIVSFSQEENSKVIIQGGTGYLIDLGQIKTNQAWLENTNDIYDIDKWVDGPVTWISIGYFINPNYIIEAEFNSGWSYSTTYDKLNLFRNAPIHFPQYNFNLGIKGLILNNDKQVLSIGVGLGFMKRTSNQVNYVYTEQNGTTEITDVFFRYLDLSDFNICFNFSYSKNIYKNLNVGIRSSVTYGIYYGLNSLIISPLIEYKF